MTEDDYFSAKICLLAANRIFAQVETDSNDDEFSRKINETECDLKRCWVKYCVAFLEWSAKKQTMRNVAAELEALEDAKPEVAAIEFDLQKFKNFEVKLSNRQNLFMIENLLFENESKRRDIVKRFAAKEFIQLFHAQNNERLSIFVADGVFAAHFQIFF